MGACPRLRGCRDTRDRPWTQARHGASRVGDRAIRPTPCLHPCSGRADSLISRATGGPAVRSGFRGSPPRRVAPSRIRDAGNALARDDPSRTGADPGLGPDKSHTLVQRSAGSDPRGEHAAGFLSRESVSERHVQQAEGRRPTQAVGRRSEVELLAGRSEASSRAQRRACRQVSSSMHEALHPVRSASCGRERHGAKRRCGRSARGAGATARRLARRGGSAETGGRAGVEWDEQSTRTGIRDHES